jgi:hypothetical protein
MFELDLRTKLDSSFTSLDAQACLAPAGMAT